MKKLITVLAMVTTLAAVCALAGCANPNGGEGTSNPTPTSAPATSAPNA